MDRVEYYSDEQIEAWYKAFELQPPHVMNLKHIPFSYNEVQKEYYRRYWLKDEKGSRED